MTFIKGPRKMGQMSNSAYDKVSYRRIIIRMLDLVTFVQYAIKILLGYPMQAGTIQHIGAAIAQLSLIQSLRISEENPSYQYLTEI